MILKLGYAQQDAKPKEGIIMTKTTRIWNSDGSCTIHTQNTTRIGSLEITDVHTRHKSKKELEDEAMASAIGLGIVAGGALLVAGVSALIDVFSSKK